MTVKAGEGLIALNQSANRGEEAFPDPDAFDIRHSPNPQVGAPSVGVVVECGVVGWVGNL